MVSVTDKQCIREKEYREKILDAMNTFRKELVNGRIQPKNASFSKGREINEMVNFKIILDTLFMLSINNQISLIK